MENIKLSTDWQKFLDIEKEKPYFKTLISNVNTSYQNGQVFPDKNDIFKSLNYFNIKDLKVVILGQDPYPTPGRAHGLAFSFGNNEKPRDSLKNIFAELSDDLGIKRTNSDLSDWAKQGVLLLNCSLTIDINNKLSHRSANFGWVTFINNLISYVNRNVNTIFVLWGNDAKKKKELIDEKKQIIIESGHPSNMGGSYLRGFKNTKPFSKINEYLRAQNKKEIIW